MILEHNNMPGMPYCKICGEPMAVMTSIGLMEKSNFIDCDICRDCMIEHCVSTNCFACSIGKYPECEHLELKRNYMRQED